MNLIDLSYDNKHIISILSKKLESVIDKDTIIVCIGTNKIIMDVLGPLVGTLLIELNYNHLVFGTLNEPIHALNIRKFIKSIKKNYPKSKIIAIDVCISEDEKNLGKILLDEGPICPGSALGKALPPIGQYSIKAIPTTKSNLIQGDFNYNNVCFQFVAELAKIITLSLIVASRNSYLEEKEDVTHIISEKLKNVINKDTIKVYAQLVNDTPLELKYKDTILHKFINMLKRNIH